jgi:DNA polymerase-1
MGLLSRNKDALRAALALPDPTDLTDETAETDETLYRLIRGPADLPAVRATLDSCKRVALDLESTGLNPHKDRVRLLQLAAGREVFVLDLFTLDPAPLWPTLAGRELVVFNAAFDLGFLWQLGFRPGRVCDLMLMARLLTAGTREGNTLADVALRELGMTLDKEQQASDWTGELSREQLDYAARDARVTLDLYAPIMAKIKAAGLERVAEIENRAVPAFVWLAASGCPFDPAAWEALAVEAEARTADLEKQLNRKAPARENGAPWNWRSWQQVKAAFAELGIDLPSTGDAVLAGVGHPLAVLLREHRQASQLVKAFGRKWRDFADDGRIHAGWNQLGAASGRTVCKTPNLQQVPKDPRYRCCFKAPPGSVLVRADYGQLQLRIAAKVADEKTMLQAFQAGEDLHTLTARRVTGKTRPSQDDRQLAKVLNFGLLFGMGARALANQARQEYGMELTEAEAKAHRDAFFESYAGLAKWHQKAARVQYRARLGFEPPGESRTILGRRRLFDRETPLTFRLASPVQGAEADGAKLAMALLWERSAECPGAFPVAFVHDEIVVEADAGRTEQAAAWLKGAMVDGMREILDPIPVAVEVTAGSSWGEQKPVEAQPGRFSPPLKWHGGKQPLAKKILGLIPPHTHYVEPYAGGLAVLLAKDPEGISEVVNDLDGSLTNFWRTLQGPESFGYFRRAVEAVPVSEQEWSDATARLTDPDPVARAVAFFIRCRQSLAGRMKGFTALSRARTRNGMNEQASAWLSAVEGLPAVHARLRRVVIRNKPALEVIKAEDAPGTLFYCDPPYLQSTRRSPEVYAHEMSEADHRELLRVLRSVKGKVMLSGYRSELYDRKLAGWNRHDFKVANQAAHGPRKREMTECVWCNF